MKLKIDLENKIVYVDERVSLVDVYEAIRKNFGADLLLLFQLTVYNTPYYYLVELALKVGLAARCDPDSVLVLGYGGQAGDHFLVAEVADRFFLPQNKLAVIGS